MSRYPHLFEPIRINRFTYKNRIVTGPMSFPLDFQDSEKGRVHYRKIEERARGGAAAVILGETSVNFADAARLPFRPVDYTRYSGFDFEGFQRYADIIHHYGAVALIEIFHAGLAKDLLPGGPNPRGPISFIREDGVPVEQMDAAMMDQCCEDFATTAAFMQAAGFDGVLTHSGHGWLFAQFLSPLYNRRTDEYGGSLENRARFPIEIFKRIRKKVGPDFIIEARLSGRDGVPGGIEAEDIGRFCRRLEGIVDSVHISAGLYYNPVDTHQFSSMYAHHGCNAEMAATVKKFTSLPVGVIGGINSPEMADRIIADGKADFVLISRQAIADPDFPNKALGGRDQEIRKCLRCYNCMPGSPHVYKYDLKKMTGFCTVNPRANPPVKLEDLPAPRAARKVLVVGGGPAGLQAAITAAERGHRVTLVEKGAGLGGILQFTDHDIDKVDLRNFKDLLINEVKRLGVTVQLNREVTPELIRQMQPEAVILALGASALQPPLPGIQHAVPVLEVYNSPQLIGQRVVMVGGGLAGCETGVHLAGKGHKVTVIEMLERLADESFGMYREALVKEMEKRGVAARVRTRCLEIVPNGVKLAAPSGAQSFIEADSVVYALGMQPNQTTELEAAAAGIPVYSVGDCVRSGRVVDATQSAFLAAFNIV